MDPHEKALFQTAQRLDLNREGVRQVIDLYLTFRAQDADAPVKIVGDTPKWFTDKHPDYHPEKMSEIWKLLWSWAPISPASNKS